MAYTARSKAESLGVDIWRRHDYSAPGLQEKNKPERSRQLDLAATALPNPDEKSPVIEW